MTSDKVEWSARDFVDPVQTLHEESFLFIRGETTSNVSNVESLLETFFGTLAHLERDLACLDLDVTIQPESVRPDEQLVRQCLQQQLIGTQPDIRPAHEESDRLRLRSDTVEVPLPETGTQALNWATLFSVLYIPLDVLSLRVDQIRRRIAADQVVEPDTFSEVWEWIKEQISRLVSIIDAVQSANRIPSVPDGISALSREVSSQKRYDS